MDDRREHSDRWGDDCTMRLILLFSVIVGLLSNPSWPGWAPSWAAETGAEFKGSVASVDAAAKKFAVKKEGGGSRFTFVVNDKTKFEGEAKSLNDLKPGIAVTVHYVVTGSQYIALRVR